MSYAIGIDLGGTSLKFAVVSAEGTLCYTDEIPSRASEGREAVITQINHAIDACLSQSLPICGIGIGTPGITDEQGRTIEGGAENIVGWEDVPLAEILEQAYHLPVCIANDANAMALGEQAYGAARGCTDVLFITVGTGIGGALIIGGCLYGGYKNRGTELGHTPIVAGGEPCACGSSGCLEAYASTSALVRRFETLCDALGVEAPATADGRTVVELYHRSHPAAMRAMEEHWFYLGRALAGFINTFSPQRIVVGGGISEAGSFYIDALRRVALGQAIADCSVNTTIEAARLGNRAGVLGAARLILSNQTCNQNPL